MMSDLGCTYESNADTSLLPLSKHGSFFRVGLNNVAKALEKKQLALLIITIPVRHMTAPHLFP
jgi:ribosomal protein L7Ae-like RNA K-turn-binding protein